MGLGVEGYVLSHEGVSCQERVHTDLGGLLHRGAGPSVAIREVNQPGFKSFESCAAQSLPYAWC